MPGVQCLVYDNKKARTARCYRGQTSSQTLRHQSPVAHRDALRDYLLAAVVMVASVAVQTTFTLAKTDTEAALISRY